MSEKEYYFIYCSLDQNKGYSGGKFKKQILSSVHPLQWQKEINEYYVNKLQGMKPFMCARFKVISWQKITKKEYDEFLTYIGNGDNLNWQ